MITKMQKFTFLVTANEYEGFLERLRKEGVAHVQQLQQGATSPDFEQGRAWAERYKRVLARLDQAQALAPEGREVAGKAVDPTKLSDVLREGQRCVEAIEALQTEEADYQKKVEDAQRQVDVLEPWGECPRENLDRLAAQGWQVRFYVCATKAFQHQWADYYATPISEQGGKTYFVTFTPTGSEVPIDAEAVQLPPEPLSHYLAEAAHAEARLAEIQAAYLKAFDEQRSVLLAAQVANDNETSLSRVRLSSASLAEDQVKMLVGWVPEEKAVGLSQWLNEAGIYYEAEAPTLEDEVPVQIRNDKFSTLFEPILRMYSLPNYQDLDILPFMSPFFMLFFGLCMGDAGYGLIILALCVALRAKLPAAQRGYATLGILLGAMTIVCGTLTGTLFGIDLTQQNWAFLAGVKPYFVNEANYTIWGYSPMMVISIIIGLVQVLFGMVLASVKASLLHGWRYGVGKMSWVVALLCLICAFGVPACGVSLPLWLTYGLYGLLALSCVGIYFYNTPQKNIFLNFGTGLWNTYGMATGLLGDLLSYIRLFALGLTGGVLGSVFNSLAIDMTGSLPWAIRWLPMLLILLIGHGINFALCMISSFVHPMRLTFVEFFKNADFNGGGQEYDPFRIKTINSGQA